MRYLGLAFLLAVGWLLAAAAVASPIRYRLSFAPDTVPIQGAFSGPFSFDDSIIPAGGGQVIATDLLTGLSFQWNGVAYDETTAFSHWLEFDPAGALSAFVICDHVDEFGQCALRTWEDDWLALA